jgi:hypothetical protein
MTSPDHALALCPEFAFLLAATAWPHDDEAIARIRGAAAAVTEIERLLALTRRHHVTGLVARALAHCGDILDSPVRQELTLEALDLAEEQFRQLLQTHRAVLALRARGIPVVVLKGVPAALAIYGEAGVRRSVDIDLLVRRSDLETARDTLENTGYSRSDPPRDAGERQVRASLRYGKDWGFDHHHSDTGMELHWRLFQNPRLVGRIGMEDAVECTVAPGIALPVVRPGIAALYLVAHGAEHAWSRLKWLADLAAVLRREPDAANRLMIGAVTHGIANMTMAALLLCHDLYESPLPAPEYRDVASSWRTRRLVDIARASLIGEQDGTELEHRAMATTRKNLGHYLFSTDPRFWWRELAYDLFHQGDGGLAGLAQRAANVALLQLS